MRRSASISFFLVILSVVAGYMLSGSDWGSSTYSDYEFLKDWWVGAIVVFGVLVFLYALQSLILRSLPHSFSVGVNILAIGLAIVGAIYSIYTFRQPEIAWGGNFLGGVLLFWTGWLTISIYLLLQKRISKALNKKVGIDV